MRTRRSVLPLSFARHDLVLRAHGQRSRCAGMHLSADSSSSPSPSLFRTSVRAWRVARGDVCREVARMRMSAGISNQSHCSHTHRRSSPSSPCPLSCAIPHRARRTAYTGSFSFSCTHHPSPPRLSSSSSPQARAPPPPRSMRVKPTRVTRRGRV